MSDLSETQIVGFLTHRLIFLVSSCGTVCLSLLGTWQGQNGEEWNEKTSTILQVISINSLPGSAVA